MRPLKIWVFVLCSMAALTAAAQKYVGGDISLLPSYEAAKANYMDQNGTKIADMLTFLKQQGWNAIRVRLFVDPSKASTEHKNQGVRQDLAYVKAFGTRIKKAGFKFMLDFHYSDTWTDPGQHSTPSQWSQVTNTTELADSLFDYTLSCLDELKEAGAEPDFIQTGNEITYGMLWPTGHCYADGGNYGTGTWANFAKYLKAATEACRMMCPNAKIVLQTEMSRTDNVTKFYDTAQSYGIDYDIVGISYYPHYHGTLAMLEGVLNTLETNHPDKKIEIVETGYFHKWYPYKATYPVSTFPNWPATNEGQRQFAADLVAMLNKHTSVDGLYWWSAESNEYGVNWQNAVTPSGWYNASLWDNETGRALPALAELKAFAPNDTGIKPTPDPSLRERRPSTVYDPQGRKVADDPSSFILHPSSRKGIYIIDGKKINF